MGKKLQNSECHFRVNAISFLHARSKTRQTECSPGYEMIFKEGNSSILPIKDLVFTVGIVKPTRGGGYELCISNAL